MSTERTILEGLVARQREIEAQMRAKQEEVAQLKRQLQKLKKAQAALDGNPDKSRTTRPQQQPSTDNQRAPEMREEH